MSLTIWPECIAKPKRNSASLADAQVIIFTDTTISQMKKSHTPSPLSSISQCKVSQLVDFKNFPFSRVQSRPKIKLKCPATGTIRQNRFHI